MPHPRDGGPQVRLPPRPLGSRRLRVSVPGHTLVLTTFDLPDPRLPIGSFVVRCTCDWVSSNVNRDLLSLEVAGHLAGVAAAAKEAG